MAFRKDSINALLALVLLILGSSVSLAASINSVSASDSQIVINLNNPTAQSIRLYEVTLYGIYYKPSPGPLVYQGTANGNVTLSRYSGANDRLYSAYQLTDSSGNAIGNPIHVVNVASMSYVIDNNPDGWTVGGAGLNLATDNGQLSLTYSNPSPAAFDPFLNQIDRIDANQVSRLAVRMRVTGAGVSSAPLGVFCFPTDGRPLSYKNATVTCNGQWQTLNIDLSTMSTWSGQVTFRIDPPDGQTYANFASALIEIDWIALTNNASFSGVPGAGDLFWGFQDDRNFDFMHPNTKKGLQVKMVDDALALGVRHAAYNMTLSQLIDFSATPAFTWMVDGQAIGINWSYVESLDAIVKPLTDSGINVSLIINNPISSGTPSSYVFRHPWTVTSPPNNLGAINISDANSLRYFRAAMEFMAFHYSQPDLRYGWVSQYIVGNELNSHWYWYNIGDSIALNSVAYEYMKAVRTADLAVRSINPNLKVAISLDHFWNLDPDGTSSHQFKGKDMLEEINTTANLRGNFPWAVAYHPYPEDLRDPEFWNDTTATFDWTSSRITPKNLEVLVSYLQQSYLTWQGKQRAVNLTEQGFDSAVVGQARQAASYAYAWRLIANIPGIDSFVLHRHVDHQLEGGLLLGLWTYDTSVPGDYDYPKDKKSIYNVFDYADTAQWQTYFNPYLTYLPFSNWDDAMPRRTAVDFTFAGGLDKWHADNNMNPLTAYAGNFVVSSSTGADPFMSHNTTFINASYNPTISILMKNTAGTTGQIYWTRKDQNYYSEAKSQTFTITPDGKYRLYTVNLANHAQWSGIITDLRLDPTNATGSSIGVGFMIAGTPQGPDFDFNTNLSGWVATNQVSGLDTLMGVLMGTSTGGDPFIERPDMFFAGSSNTTVQIRMAVNAGTAGQLFWSTSEEPYSSAAKSATFTLIPDGQYHTYTLNLGSHAYWNAKNIVALRLDPTNSSNATFYVDSILTP